MKKGSTQNIIINPVRNGQVSDYSFANFLLGIKVKKYRKHFVLVFEIYRMAHLSALK